jgi:hypothetical protein
MAQIALVAAVLGDIPREGLRIAAMLAAVVLVPVLLVVIAAAGPIAALLSGSGAQGDPTRRRPRPSTSR